MAKRRLRLVQPGQFDLERFKSKRPPPPDKSKPAFQKQRRLRIAETFARIPHERGFALAYQNLSGAAWALLIMLDWLILDGYGKNPVRLTYQARRAVGLTRFTTMRALRQLEAAGAISVERRPGQAPLVTHLWFSVG